MSEAPDRHYGSWIRDARRSRQLTVEEVSEATRIDRQYLMALEAGNIALLPEPYMRAFLKTYAAYLGLDPVEALRRFEEFLKEESENLNILRETIRERDGRRVTLQPETVEPDRDYLCAPPSRPVSVRIVEGILGSRFLKIAGTLILIAAIVFALVQFTEIDERLFTANESAGGADSGEVEETPETPGGGTQAVTPEPEREEPPVRAEPQAVTTKTVFLGEAIEDTWMEAIADGELVVSRTIAGGARVRVTFSDTLRVILGKNRGMRLYLDDEELTDLGPAGMVLSLVLTPDGVIQRRLTYPPEDIPDILNIPPGQ